MFGDFTGEEEQTFGDVNERMDKATGLGRGYLTTSEKAQTMLAL